MDKLIIVGAGISGLTAGVYAARSGFDVLIVERLGTPGGVSTCWKRKGYTIEGGVHWLTGSSPERPLCRVWKQTGALKDNNPIYNKDPFFVFSGGGKDIPLWRDPAKMEATLLEVAPEDRRAIRRLVRHIRWFRDFHSPVGYIPGLKCAARVPFNLMEYVRMLPALLLTPMLWATSVQRYTARFRNPNVRALLRGIMNPQHNALSYIVTLSSFCYGDSGYPTGGSLLMAKNMEETFLETGGKVKYGCNVTKVTRHGVETASDGFLEADAVLVTVDARSAIDMLFGKPLQHKWADKMRSKLFTAQCMLIGIGVEADLSDMAKSTVIRPSQPFVAGGLSYDILTVHNYARDGYAPDGCSTLTVLLLGNSYHWWKQAREDGTYYERKQDVVDRLLEVLYGHFPAIRGKVAVTDIATPLTVERYCHNYEGSYMSVWKPCTIPPKAPLRYLRGLYFAGQRTSLSGGLPIAVSTGRKVVQYICRDFHHVFTEE